MGLGLVTRTVKLVGVEEAEADANGRFADSRACVRRVSDKVKSRILCFNSSYFLYLQLLKVVSNQM